ncbi:MAG: ABC transporter permease [Oxalicibacterium faecigallinarum]|uniref:MlaE family ABC transporter permease n=1 Tax=Oxalicibacterium faecigallinarum TaxID=573741 RepID=UPI0028087B42|nr:ABC transporter permease [Oxalicibacterium faecigallinarum]MDQ7969376.1 ABC transporter permease [Oxalicibacterium faecigallinarum]
MPDHVAPSLGLSQDDHATATASGSWHVRALTEPQTMARINLALKTAGSSKTKHWDLSQIEALDYIGAQLLWNAWGKQRPSDLKLAPQHEDFFERLEETGTLDMRKAQKKHWYSLDAILQRKLNLVDHLLGFVTLIGQLTIDFGRFLRQPQRGPWKEISANIFHTGYQALGITALVGFLIGVVLSYLSAQQLHQFGGDIYLVNILGMAVIRELGPLLAAILVAGRSGSSITAQLGVMRVTEELDAMLVMGMPHGFRLILPKVIALAISMPLLVVWTDAMALIGGMVAANLELGMSYKYFLRELPDAVPLANYWIGLGKGVVFGGLIALVACHFGLRIKANTESLGQGTTISVVTAITIVILADAVFAIIFTGVGF